MYESMKIWNNKRKLQDFLSYADYAKTTNADKKIITKFFKMLNKINLNSLKEDNLKHLAQELSEVNLLLGCISESDVESNQKLYVSMIVQKEKEKIHMHNQFLKKYINAFTTKHQDERDNFIKLSDFILATNSDMFTTFRNIFAENFEPEFYGVIRSKEKDILFEHINNSPVKNTNRKRL